MGKYMIGTNPTTAFILVIVIGIAAGMLYDRFAGQPWITQFVGGQRSSATTSLVGIAGAIIGYHLGMMGQMMGLSAYVGFLGAMLGAGLADEVE
jgi:hypothetical protein